MRVVVFAVSGVLEAFDYRGVLIHTQAITNINEAKTTANNEINTNKQEVLNNITQQKQQATSEITEAKKTDHYQNIDFFEIE
ncbi:hypothetical protein KVC06_02410 [Helicobacter pylori]|uniref:hypothetical protein n=1 Tax=Helicobacter pylori TaxID=210 RepID=UPI0027120CFC|nr:hypothetical protein [Helicobacter pylori]MDO7812360.1 hypothetical protein [Helicobacter pylori]WQU19703.1 hypothetical protein KVC06_02410 [Helicobacter pylori]